MPIIIAEYIWIGGNNYDLRSKSRTLMWDKETPISINDIPQWNYDGSSTNQANGENSEVLLIPVSLYKDPFRGGGSILVMCETFSDTKTPALNNNRANSRLIFNKEIVQKEIPLFGLEQEYTLFQKDKKTPLGWPEEGFPEEQGPYYCGVGYDNAVGRKIANDHYRICLDAGLIVSGINAEVMKGQWEYQIGPCSLMDIGDQMWISRYIMYRISELYEVYVSFDPKPIEGDWNGAGCHVNYSTLSMRTGVENSIEKTIFGLSNSHKDFIKIYGEGNERRMTGKHETSKLEEFSYGVANRKCSIRIPINTMISKSGYIEDRRPASNIDPYLVTASVVDVTLVKNYEEEPDYADSIAEINKNIFQNENIKLEKIEE